VKRLVAFDLKLWAAFWRALLVLAVLHVCSEAKAEDKPSVIRIANPGVGIGGRPVVAYGPWSLLHIKGELEEEFKPDGIKVTWTFARGAGPAVNEQFANNLADISHLGDLPSIIARSGGLRTKVLAASSLSNLYIAVPADSPVKTVKDLVGRRLAVFKGTCIHLAANRILASQGLAEKDLRTINMDQVSTLAALTTGDVDAAIAGSELIALKERGAVRIIYTTKGDLRYTCNSTIVAAESFVNKYPSTVKRILRRYVRAVKWVTDNEQNPTDIFNLFSKSGIPFNSLKSDWVGDSFKGKASPLIDPYLRDRYRTSIKDAYKFGLIKKEFDVDSWFDDKLLNEVLKEENLVGYWPQRQPK
jgi:sulfonate transport system substrate-binding protein